MECKDVGVGDPTAAALIGAARIHEPVAQHPRAARQCRADRARDMIRARSREQQSLAARIPAIVAPFHKQRADGFGARAAAGLARCHYLDRARRECLRKRPDLRRFADAFAALERDEAPLGHCANPR